jgi:hypothetical protein
VLTISLQTISIFNLPLENENQFSPFYGIINCRGNYIKVTNISDILSKKNQYFLQIYYTATFFNTRQFVWRNLIIKNEESILLFVSILHLLS